MIDRDTKMAANSLKLSLPGLPDEPHLPKNFEFPKRTFVKSKTCTVLRAEPEV